jgi:CHAT domain-containing protein
VKRIECIGTKFKTYLSAAVLWFAVLSITAQDMTVEQQRARQTALALATQAASLETSNQWAEALPLRVKLTAVLTEAFGEGHPQTDQGRETLANSLTMLGRYGEARAIWEKCLAARRSALGDHHFRVAEAWLGIGETFRRQGQFTAALDANAHAEQIATSLPDSDLLRSTIANNQAVVFAAQGDLIAAEQHFSNSLVLLDQVQGASPVAMAKPLSGLGDARRLLGKYADAEKDLLRARSLLSGLPSHSPFRLLNEGQLAQLYQKQGRTREAIAIYDEIIPVLATQRGPIDWDVLALQRSAAVARAGQQDHAAALQGINECLDRLVKAGQTNHPLFSALLTDQADRLADLGDLTGARLAYESVLQTSPDVLATDKPGIWTARERLAVVARDQGDLDTARDLLEKVLNYRQQHAAENLLRREEQISTMLEWARFQRVTGRLGKVDTQLSEILELLRQHFAPNHPLAAELWTEAGFLAEAQGRLDRALTNQQRALQIRQEILGEHSVLTVQSQINVADILARQGKVETALQAMAKAYAAATNYFPVGSPVILSAEFNLANLLHRSGRLDEAALHYESALRAMEKRKVRHFATVARDLSFLELERGHPEAAVSYAKQASESQLKLWQNVMRFASEDERLAWQGNYDLFSALASVADKDPLPLAQAVLQFKGAVLDSIIEDAQILAKSKDAAVAQQVAELQTARRECYRLELTAQSSRQISPTAAQSARDRVERLESDLAGRVTALPVSRRISSVTVAAVQKALPADTALLEFVRYERWLGRGRTEPSYGVLVITKTEVPKWRVLGGAGTNQAIATAIANWQAKIHEEVPPEGMEIVERLQSLHDEIWPAIAPLLTASTRTVIVAPDGDFNFVSFAALWHQDHFLGEDLAFRYVASGRDLLAPAYQPPTEKRVCIVSAPEYARSGWQRRVVDPLKDSLANLATVLALRGGGINEILPFYPDLPFTRVEADRIAKLARQAGLQVPTPLAGGTATEKAVREFSNPYLLHLATHASFLSDASITQALGLVASGTPILVPRNPMHRSFVGLARANETFDAWRQGSAPDPMNDGLLSAQESALLKLDRTWLVTLSACDSGLGVGRTGEGVFGLRRGFMAAGARHILMTLWPVQDNRTVQFMEQFYAGALKSGDAAGELARVQGRLLKEWRTVEGPGRAARFAGAFVITSSGP